jgi:hypothetical protein
MNLFSLQNNGHFFLLNRSRLWISFSGNCHPLTLLTWTPTPKPTAAATIHRHEPWGITFGNV